MKARPEPNHNSPCDSTTQPLMIQVNNYINQLIDEIGNSWNRFWFQPGTGQPLAWLRIGTGIVALWYWLSFFSTFSIWLAPDGLLPLDALKRLTGVGEQTVYRWSVFFLTESPTVLSILYGLGLVAIVLHLVGLGGRWSTLTAWFFVLSMVHRLPMATGLVEPVLCMSLLYLAIGQSTGDVAVDRRWLARTSSDSTWNNISLRLLQIHTLFFYVVMGLTQLRHGPWWEGDAVWTLLASSETRPFDLTFLGQFPFALNLVTHAIVAFELLFPLLIWKRSLRPLLITLACVFWMTIAITTGLFLYAAIMAVLSLAFWPFTAQTQPKTESDSEPSEATPEA